MRVFAHLFAQALGDLVAVVVLWAPLLAAFFGAAAVLARPSGAWLAPGDLGAAAAALAGPDALALAVLLGLLRSERRLALEGTMRALGLLPARGHLARCAAPLALVPFLVWHAKAVGDWAPYGLRVLWGAAARGSPPSGEVARREIPRLLARAWGLGAAYLPPDAGQGQAARLLFFHPGRAGRYLAGRADLRAWRHREDGLELELANLVVSRGRWPAAPSEPAARAGRLVLHWPTPFGRAAGVVPPGLVPDRILDAPGAAVQALSADPDPAAAARRLADLERERRRRANQRGALFCASAAILVGHGGAAGAVAAGLAYLLVRGPLAANLPPLGPVLAGLLLLAVRILRGGKP